MNKQAKLEYVRARLNLARLMDDYEGIKVWLLYLAKLSPHPKEKEEVG